MRLIDADILFEKVGKIKPRSKEEYELIGKVMNMITYSYTESPNNWIPCTPETMPEDEYVLISKKPTKISGSKWSVAIAIRTADPRSRKIQWRDSGFGIIQDDKVLAWMPLPEPYKEGNDEVN